MALSRSLVLMIALTMAISGCTGPGVALPKTLNLSVEYNSQGDIEALQANGVNYEFIVTDPFGNIIFEERGIVRDGLKEEYEIVFDHVGPFTLDIELDHPLQDPETRQYEFDFHIWCRAIDEFDIAAAYNGGEFSVSMGDYGPLCFLPED